MLDLWITNNIATQLWKGHSTGSIHLDANGLRQGCTLSPILYLVIIDALVSDKPGTVMPDWDEGFIDIAFTQGVQTLKGDFSLGEWLVYLFVDDTAFVSRDIHTTNAMLMRYHNFSRKWRIRVNPDKCKLLKNDYCTDTTPVLIGDQTVKPVDFLKYLGYWIGSCGRDKNDMHIKAQATQLRFKIRLIRARLGEYLARVYLEVYATPSILHGAKLGMIPNAKLNTCHAWALSMTIVQTLHLC